MLTVIHEQHFPPQIGSSYKYKQPERITIQRLTLEDLGGINSRWSIRGGGGA